LLNHKPIGIVLQRPGEVNFRNSGKSGGFVGGFGRRRELFRWTGVQQCSVFDQSAELLFGDVMMGALAGLQVFDRFVFHFEAMQLDNAQVFVTCFPDLALLQFHRRSAYLGGSREQWGCDHSQDFDWLDATSTITGGISGLQALRFGPEL
jgi:hypothetical protein